MSTEIEGFISNVLEKCKEAHLDENKYILNINTKSNSNFRSHREYIESQLSQKLRKLGIALHSISIGQLNVSLQTRKEPSL